MAGRKAAGSLTKARIFTSQEIEQISISPSGYNVERLTVDKSCEVHADAFGFVGGLLEFVEDISLNFEAVVTLPRRDHNLQRHYLLLRKDLVFSGN